MKISEFKSVTKILSVFAGIILFAYVVVAGISFFSYAVLGNVQKSDFLYIPTGSTLSEQANKMVEDGFLKDTTEMMVYVKKMRVGEFQPGKYSVEKGMTYLKLFHMLEKGRQTPARIIFNNIDDKEELVGRLSTQIELDSLALLDMFANDTLLAKFNLTPENALFIFIPNTYEVYWDISEEKLLTMIRKEYDKFWKAREEKLGAITLTREEVINLASIVEKECTFQDEMSTVAGIYINRLTKNMPLQADPTVKYAVGDRTLRRILHKHLEVESPYNTYRHTGLPPTPISLPSIAAIDAVLNYKKSDYLYFCASDKMDGRHRFSSSYNEHIRNAHSYARALNAAGILN
ncbi:MAG: endolytic transglycosylase MltG [Rikenellaceae bacterium]